MWCMSPLATRASGYLKMQRRQITSCVGPTFYRLLALMDLPRSDVEKDYLFPMNIIQVLLKEIARYLLQTGAHG
jgi:hypothetical protein